MNLQDDSFYSRIPTLSDDELLGYITHHSRYKMEAVQLAVAELRKRGIIISDDELAKIEAYFKSKSGQTRRRLYFNRSLVRRISYIIFGAGICISATIYIFARPLIEDPLGYHPLKTKVFLRQLEVYGGKGNVMAAELREWFAGLWQGRNLSYTVAFITVIISIILWYIGTRKHADPD
jgi:hypothetical protein